MKFGQNLPRNQVPEWASSYINYKGLKKLIKAAEVAEKNEQDVDLAEFFYSLDRNLEDVDAFYNKRFGETARKLRLLHERYGRATQVPEGMDKDEVEDLMGALLEVRGTLRNLQWYGEVNRRGFVKITKKLDKKITHADTQKRYIVTKVDPKPFATNNKLHADLKAINDWLSALGEAKTFDDTGSTGSVSSMRRATSKTVLNLPPNVLESLETAVRADEAASLGNQVTEISTQNPNAAAALNQLLLSLLQRAVSCKAKKCIEAILPQLSSIDDDEDLNKRNCIHRLVITIGRKKSVEIQARTDDGAMSPAEMPNFILPAAMPVKAPPRGSATEDESTLLLTREDEMVQLLNFLLAKLEPHQRVALSAKDAYGRLPLHYAAQYGFVIICQTLIKYMQIWDQFDVSKGIDSPIWQDDEGNAPLHLSVIGGHPLTTKCLLDAERWKGESIETLNCRKHISKSGEVLAMATKSNALSIVKLLVGAGVNVNHTDDQGESALHIAARFGFVDCARVLIEGSKTEKADLEVAEKTFGWTPLFIACVDGFLPVVELLVLSGAHAHRKDESGWTPKEHAALRGHMDIVDRLTELVAPQPDLHLGVPNLGTSPPKTTSLEDRRSNAIAKESSIRPIKTFGHRYLTKESMVLVSLGSMDTRKNVPAVKLENIALAEAHATQLDTALSVVVSATGAAGEPTIIDLPVRENISTAPITFMTTDPSKVKLLFDIIPTYAGSKDKVVGRGVAMLQSLRPSIGTKRISLQGDISVPILATPSLDIIGSVNFNFLIITPFDHPNMSITTEHTYWKKVAAPQIIGHRGLGKNVATQRSLQLGENTIQSFIAAANLGASYVEFDVQLTKDHVPVIYHDFLVSETGIDAPVHTLTLEQFLHISDQRTPRSSRPGSPDHKESTETTSTSNGKRRHRSYSLGGSTRKDPTNDMSERMKHTRDFKRKGFKGNSRGAFIQAPFTTLEEMFQQLPEHIGFNIEMKYPMLFESEDEGMDTYAVDLNTFVDTVLTKVYNLANKRNIIFSSFNPDICLLLSWKQPSIPVLFLTDAGTSPVGDIRAGSLQEAIRFASRWNLLGVVSAAQPLVACPRLVGVVKESGLVCVSYGTLNNDPVNVNLQVKGGIDAVIVDSVLAIRKGLQGPHPEATPATSVNGHAEADADASTVGEVVASFANSKITNAVEQGVKA